MASVVETFGARVRRLRRRAGFATQIAFADALGVTHQTVSQWECDWVAPSLATAARLARVIGVTLDYLVNGEEMPAAQMWRAA